MGKESTKKVYMVWDVLETGRGPIELNRRVPHNSEHGFSNAVAWCATAIKPGIDIGEEFLTPAGRVKITAKSRGAFDDQPLPSSHALKPFGTITATDVEDTLPAVPEMAHTELLPRQYEELLNEEIEAANKYAMAAIAESTIAAYNSDWLIFKTWCRKRQCTALPASADTIAYFLASQAKTWKPTTLERRMAAITFVHKGNEHPVPSSKFLQSVMKGIRNTEDNVPEPRMALSVDDMRRILDLIDESIANTDDNLLSVRNYALLLTGYASAMRGSELVALEVEDITFFDEGMSLVIRKGKTDQEGKGRLVKVPKATGKMGHCPVVALLAWLQASGLTTGPVFRRVSKTSTVLRHAISRDYVRKLLKEYARKAGFKEEEVSMIGSHSLRRGWSTEVAAAMVEAKNVDKSAIMEQLGHTSEAMTNRYIDGVESFKDHISRDIL